MPSEPFPTPDENDAAEKAYAKHSAYFEPSADPHLKARDRGNFFTGFRRGIHYQRARTAEQENPPMPEPTDHADQRPTDPVAAGAEQSPLERLSADIAKHLTAFAVDQGSGKFGITIALLEEAAARYADRKYAAERDVLRARIAELEAQPEFGSDRQVDYVLDGFPYAPGGVEPIAVLRNHYRYLIPQMLPAGRQELAATFAARLERISAAYADARIARVTERLQREHADALADLRGDDREPRTEKWKPTVWPADHSPETSRGHMVRVITEGLGAASTAWTGAVLGTFESERVSSIADALIEEAELWALHVRDTNAQQAEQIATLEAQDTNPPAALAAATAIAREGRPIATVLDDAGKALAWLRENAACALPPMSIDEHLHHLP